MPSIQSKGGRPKDSGLKWREEFRPQILKLVKLGLIEDEIAEFFGVDGRTFRKWKFNEPGLLEQVKLSKLQADEKVVQSLFRRATGYTHPAVKIFENGTKVEYEEHYAPDTTAMIFWLKNRDEKKWRDRREITGAAGGSVVIKIDREDAQL